MGGAVATSSADGMAAGGHSDRVYLLRERSIPSKSFNLPLFLGLFLTGLFPGAGKGLKKMDLLGKNDVYVRVHAHGAKTTERTTTL